MSNFLSFSLLGSGSAGNAVLVISPHAKILIDSGLSYRQLRQRAEAVGQSLDGLRAVFVTHEHGDHVGGVGVLARKLKVPVYITKDTYASLPKSVGEIPWVEHFDPGDKVVVDGMMVQSYSVSHDAADPVSFVVHCGSAQLGIATDLGRVEQLVRERLRGSQALILESNYCHEKLRQSSYPASVRQRIAGSQGHLSNAAMNSLLKDLLHDGLKFVVIVHISQENNTEELARGMASRVLEGHPAELIVAEQDRPTPVFELAS